MLSIRVEHIITGKTGTAVSARNYNEYFVRWDDGTYGWISMFKVRSW